MSRKSRKKHLNSLQPGHELLWYEIREIIGQGGFGITYLANDKNLDHEVAIKEYMPVDLATRNSDNEVQALSPEHEERYAWGLERFRDEAKTLGQFKHPNIVQVRNVFQANNTAYMVMDYELGESLQEILSRRKILNEEDIQQVIYPIIDGMKLVHAHGFIHRDIKPANIFIRVDGDPVLLDFGSARQAVEESRNVMTSIFSKGYAPIEQYDTEEDQQGPWTDIYAFGATMYRAIAGIPPIDAINRSTSISMAGRDTYVSAVEIGEDRYSRELLLAVDHAMQFRRQDRPQTVSEWRATLNESSVAPISTPAPVAEPETGPDSVDPLSEHLKRAHEGDAEAQSALAYMYAKGINTTKDEAEALKWYEVAARQDHAGSQYNLGVMYARGRGVVQDHAKALKYYQQAAQQGESAAQATLGVMYMKGVGTEKDEKAAFDWCFRAAKRGHLNSTFYIGEMYAHGRGVSQNFPEAFKWYKKAANKGHIGGQLNLAYMYGKGQGTERNDTEAFHWYRKAADAGDANAQYNLGVIYAKGRGIARNIDEAKQWYNKAAAQGNENAARALAKLVN